MQRLAVDKLRVMSEADYGNGAVSGGSATQSVLILLMSAGELRLSGSGTHQEV
jgi:hypothetical protein